MEQVSVVDDVQHPIVREALRAAGIEQPHLEITSMADIPAGTGLGSSGSFTTALLKALHTYRKNIVHRRRWQNRRARLRSSGSASRSESRTSTSPRTAD